ncbi:GGDEF domain-containing protein [Bacterioplanes sanyensis]|uniref:GGDEF domain-containing protein n=1 Tax=Bacterioplanes sanyensis TaxID=1249553 RepID=UPI00167A4055|nr:diguanylate cyclase [Bacterioplanes sanyensis]
MENYLPRANIHIEYLDDRRFIDDPTLRQHMVTVLNHKYQRTPPDLIITTDDSALALVLNELSPWAANVPLVFGGVNIPEQHDLSGQAQYTGVYEGMAIEENLALIQHVLPQTRRIIIIADEASTLGQLMASKAKALQSEQLEVWSYFTLSELNQRLRQLPAQSAVLLLALHKDARGKYFSYQSSVPDLTASSRAPVFAMWGSLMLGHGVVGGAMNDGTRHGHHIADQALQILQGKPASNIPVRQGEYLPAFDYRQLRRFNIPMTRLPADATLLFEPVPFLQRHQTGLLILAVVVVILSAIISILSINIRRRARAEERWQTLRIELEQKVSERTEELAERNRQLSQLTDNLKRQVNTDPLTGIANRRLGKKRLLRLCESHSKNDAPLTLAIVDIDHFKRINDLHGHAVGDLALVEVASFLTGHMRPTDTVARWGGEEFLLLMPATTLDEAEAVCERLRSLARQMAVQDNHNISISVGVAAHQPGESDEALLERADRCLYLAKSNGRDRVTTELELSHL